MQRPILREKCPYLEFFWSIFSRIWTEYGEISVTPYTPYLSVFSLNTIKYEPEKTPNTDTFHAVLVWSWVTISFCQSFGNASLTDIFWLWKDLFVLITCPQKNAVALVASFNSTVMQMKSITYPAAIYLFKVNNENTRTMNDAQ